MKLTIRSRLLYVINGFYSNCTYVHVFNVTMPFVLHLHEITNT